MECWGKEKCFTCFQITVSEDLWQGALFHRGKVHWVHISMFTTVKYYLKSETNFNTMYL